MMRFIARIWLVLVFGCAIAAAAAPAALGAFGVSKWEAGTCINHTCTYKSVEENHSEAFTQAAGHPQWGITTFELNHKKGLIAEEPEGAPLKRVRVDVAPGLASDPQAPLTPTTHEKCSIEAFKKNACPAGTEVGTNELTVLSSASGLDVPVTGSVYNLEPEAVEEGLGGIPLLFGIHVEIPLLANEHVFLKGYVSWAKDPRLEARGIPSGDYHEYFEINNINNTNPVLKSQLNFNGRAGGNFLTLPSECSSTTTNYIELESWTKEISTAVTHTPVGVEGCDKVPFAPSAEVKPETSQSDQPDGATTLVKVPQHAGPEEINTADIRDAHLTLPEGLTLNAAAARGLKACAPAQIAIGTTNKVECPEASKVGEVTIEADLPAKSLTGNLYLGAPAGEPITGPPYTVYLDAESPKYGVSVRLKGQVNPNPTTGRLETTFLENPQQPSSEIILKLKGGPQAPLANPLTCGSENVQALFTPYTGEAAYLNLTPFVTGGCLSPIPFSLTQSTGAAPTTGGTSTSFTLGLARSDGQQYLSRLSTTLPSGLVGRIPSVPLCGEPQAQKGECGAASQIGTATVAVGAGSEPYEFSGPVFLTGPYNGAPYGLSIPVPAVAGPFNLGTVVTRTAINVDPYTGRVIATSALPTIVGGVPLRLRSLSVLANRPNFLLNPTNCGPLETTTTLTSTFGTNQSISTPFKATGCDALAFNPKFSASSNAKTSRANGASLNVTVGYPAGSQANIKSVFTALPKQLPSRVSTLNHACLQATFNADPLACPSNSRVGEAVVTTPVLPDKLTGPAIFVSHGGAAFPDLDIVLKGDGVTVILVGNTNITNGITSSNFATVPDVPVSSFELKLPAGPNSALTAIGNICKQSLVMPTTITAQNGKVIKQNTKISVSGCPGVRRSHRLKILSHRVRGHMAIIVVKVPAAGRVSGSGKNLRRISKHPRRAQKVTLRLPLSGAGVRALRVHHRAHHRLVVRVRVSFVPKAKGPSSVAFTRVVFK
jgi:hypothetical protein